MTDLAPTEPRLALAAGIQAGQVTNHGWKRGLVTWRRGTDEVTVTARVAEFRLAGLLLEPESYPWVEQLNGDGEAWLAGHSRSEVAR